MTEFEKIKKIFSPLAVGLLHGRLKPREKEKILNDFRANKYQLLVTTPVVEVGVDIPQASIMVIEDAWKFGLAQLHQLRGRVGRNDKPAYCLLFSGTDEPEILSRLRLLEKENDGLALAEADLRLRGPGQMFGVAQSGHLDTQFTYFWDETLQKQSLRIAKELLKTPAKATTILATLDSSLANGAASN